MHWRRLRPCPSPGNPAYEIGRFEGRSIDKGRIIGLDSSNLSKHHRTQTFHEEYLAFLKKHGAHFDEKYLWD
jgi:hypothetical protein